MSAEGLGPTYAAGPRQASFARSERGYVSASETTSHKSSKSLSASGCGPLTVTSDEMNSPVSKSKVSANVIRPASRERTRPCAVWIFSGRPLKVVEKVIVPASP